MALWLLAKALGWPRVWREWRPRRQPVCQRLLGLIGWEQSVLLTGVRLCGYSRVLCVTPWDVSVEGDPRWPELLLSSQRGACRWFPDAVPLVLLRKLKSGWGSASVDLGAVRGPQDALMCVCLGLVTLYLAVAATSKLECSKPWQ